MRPIPLIQRIVRKQDGVVFLKPLLDFRDDAGVVRRTDVESLAVSADVKDAANVHVVPTGRAMNCRRGDNTNSGWKTR